MDTFSKRASELKIGDRCEFFWQELLDGSLVNGMCSIVDIKKDTSFLQLDEDDGYDCRNDYKSDEVMAIYYGLDYHEPNWAIVHRDMPVEGFTI